MYELTFSLSQSQLFEQLLLGINRAQAWKAYLQPIGHVVLAVVLVNLLRHCKACGLDEGSFVAGLFATYFCLLWFNHYFIRFLSRMHFPPSGFTLGERRLRANDITLEFKGKDYTSIYSWSAIQGVSDGKSILVLSLDNGTGLIIPKAAFNSPAELADFKRSAEARIAMQPQ